MRPYGVAVDAQDNAYVAMFGWSLRVYKILPSGQISIFVETGISDPHSLAFDADGNLWVSYYNGLRLVKVTPSGSYSVYNGGWTAPDAPNGIAFDSSGNFYVGVNGGRTTTYPAILKIGNVSPPFSSGRHQTGNSRHYWKCIQLNQH